MLLSKPIIFFDLETTGISISQDRIVQIGAIKIMPDETREEKNVLINPTVPIPPSATAIHGISDEDVHGAPLFRQIAKSMFRWFAGCDIAGYNSDNFDVPLLVEEFSRVGIEFPEANTHFIDVLKIERNVNSHRLEETYKRYSGKSLEGAHDALADIQATVTVFQKQLEQNPTLPTSIEDLDELCQGENARVDFTGRLYEKDGQIYWSFGKHKDKLVVETLDYANWVLGADFPLETKKQLRKVVEHIS